MLVLKRFWERPDLATPGAIFKDDLIICGTFERPWLDNAKQISCIPQGQYHCEWDKERERYWVRNVPERDAIQIHVGNSLADTTGCILTAYSIGLVPEVRAQNSRMGMFRLKEFGGNSFILRIE